MSQHVPRRLLVVVTADVQDATLREHVRRHAGDDAELLVVAPASDISRLDWLTNAEDDARAEAHSLADKAAEAIPATDVEAHVGDSDPVKAIEDALREFPADEVLIVTRPDDDASWLEQGSGETAESRFRSQSALSPSQKMDRSHHGEGTTRSRRFAQIRVASDRGAADSTLQAASRVERGCK